MRLIYGLHYWSILSTVVCWITLRVDITVRYGITVLYFVLIDIMARRGWIIDIGRDSVTQRCGRLVEFDTRWCYGGVSLFDRPRNSPLLWYNTLNSKNIAIHPEWNVKKHMHHLGCKRGYSDAFCFVQCICHLLAQCCLWITQQLCVACVFLSCSLRLSLKIHRFLSNRP